MGREVRRVPADWQHPKDERGHYIPLHKGSADQDIADWDLGNQMWSQGMYGKFTPDDSERGWHDEWVPKKADMDYTYEEWAGQRPDPADYMGAFPDGSATHFMMYEDTSEGTPISPAFATPEEMAMWLAETGASAFGDMTATYEEWLPICRGRFAPSLVIEGGVMKSGVEAMAND